jgi:CBS domain-containing protein
MTSTTVVAGVRQFLLGYPPFTLMAAEDVDFMARSLELAYFAPGEKIIGPDDGPPTALYLIKQGVVEGVRAIQAQALPAGESPMVQLTPGDGFPVGALMADRPVNSVYRAAGDTFCWRLPKARFDELTRRSAVFLDFCRRRMAAMLDLSNKALQASYAAQATQWRSMSAPLESVLRREPVTVPADESLEATFRLMQDEGVGSVIVMGTASAAGGKRPVAGIFTEKDVIGRVVLPQVPLDAPISQVMTSPVITLDAGAPVSDAMLLMAERTIRHVPVLRDGDLVGILTERDLFALQRRSLRQIGDSIRHARRLSELVRAASDIREWSQALVAQGVAAGFATRLISRLNDQLTARLIAMTARDQAIPIEHLCWLALGSEGREEQTIATDQDNGLIIGSENTTPREALLLFAQSVNQRLDECGYPLCKGGIMAGNPKWCLTDAEWAGQFDDWIDRGDPTSLLNANIFFDFRSLTGASQLAVLLRDRVTARAQANRRFLKQMSDNALRNAPPPSWTGGVLDQLFSSEAPVVDLKLNGTAPFVDGARLLALAAGVRATGTAERLEALAELGSIPAGEARAWTDAFQFLQSLRLRVQHERREAVENPNLLDTRQLSDLDRRILKESFRQARKLQQRLALDYPG